LPIWHLLANLSPMKITVYCLKGSAGKTPIAVNIALTHGFAIGTNEPYNLLDRFIPEERLISIEASEEFPEFPKDIDIVFDLAGMITTEASPSIVSAVKQSNVVLVPIYNELKCINAGIATINELRQYTSKIVVVATKLQKQKNENFTDWRKSADFKNIAHIVAETTDKSIPVFPLKFSKVFDTIFEKELSIGQLMESDVLARYAYRDVNTQFETLFNFLKANYAK
jgi:hypothetical protein